MGKTTIEEYLVLTEGSMPRKYEGAEEQGKAIRRCTILKEVELGYSNSSSFPVAEETAKKPISCF